MKKDWRAFQNITNICSGSILLPRKLMTVALIFLIANISGCKLLTGQLEARESQGRSNIFSMNHAQLVYFSDKNEFTTKFAQLKLTIKPETENYIFKIIPPPDNIRGIMHIAQAKSKNIKSYIGLVYAIKRNGDDYTNAIGQLCEAQNPQSLSVTSEIPSLAEDIFESKDIKCPSGFQSLNYTFATQ